MMRIYVASSWRNTRQPVVVEALRAVGHDVYDFRNPGGGDTGFQWSDIDQNWKHWAPDEYLKALQHPLATFGFQRDMDALRQCEVCVLVLPCGRSAHLELGWAIGRGRRGYILLEEQIEPELMNRMACVVRNVDQLLEELSVYQWQGEF